MEGAIKFNGKLLSILQSIYNCGFFYMLYGKSIIILMYVNIGTVDISSLWFGVTQQIISQVELSVSWLWQNGWRYIYLPLLPLKIFDLGRF